jgi:hypothetical protein
LAKFFLKLLIFLLPFALIVVALTGMLIYIGESMPLPWVVVIQQSSRVPVLYRPQYGNRDLDFKRLTIETRQPEIIVVGSSRVLQMRAGLLTEQPETFYNAGAPAWEFEEVEALLYSLDPTALPDIILLGLDQVWFNEAYEGDVLPPRVDDITNLWQIDQAVAQGIVEDGVAGRPLTLNQWLARGDPGGDGIALGIKAIENGHGFRRDGSERYGDFLVGRFLYQPTERQRHLDWLREGQQMYVYGENPSADMLNRLDALLDWCAERGIMVIGFTPPFAPMLYDQMQQQGNHDYIFALMPLLDGLFAKHSYRFFDFSGGARFGIDDDFFDGWHGSERIYLHLYIALVEALPDVLGGYTHLDTLRTLDANAPETWSVFGG